MDEQLIEHLREIHRLKINCDYAYMTKYGKTYIICDEMWEEEIKEHIYKRENIYLLPTVFIEPA